MKPSKYLLPWIAVLALVTVAVTASVTVASYTKDENAIQRIGPEEAQEMAQSGKALLVCSYDDNSCKSKMLAGALLRSEFEARVDGLDKSQTIVFYCG